MIADEFSFDRRPVDHPDETSPAPVRVFEDIWRDFTGTLHAASSLNTVFVVGPQRSGTTWTQTLLDSHPECACRFEIRMHDALMAEVHRMVASYNRTIVESSRHVPPGITAESRMHDQTHMMLLMRAMFFAHFFPLPKPGLRYIGEKTPENLLGLRDIEQVFPDARYIIVVRDGRDAGLSSWHHFRNSGSADIPLAGFLERWIPGHWEPLVEAALDLRRRLPERSFLVRYEDLSEKPEETATNMFAFLGVDHSPATVRRSLEASSFARMSGGRDRGDERSDQFLRKGVVGDWRSVFGPAERAVFHERGAALNRRLGYIE